MTVVPLGDQAVLATLPNENAAIRLTMAVREANPSWLVDVVPAYHRVGVYFNPDQINTAAITAFLNQCQSLTSDNPTGCGREFVVPVCYEHGPDLQRVAELKGVSTNEVIRLHLGTVYTVYAIGFVPGFPYLGYLPEPIAGVGRLASPRIRVEPGTVGITGRQTGIYPLPRPGGWHLIGRTPLTLVDVTAGYFPLQVGDRVRFERIDEAEYRGLDGERL